MIPKIKSIQTKENYKLQVLFYDDTEVLYDLTDDIKNLPHYDELEKTPGLYKNAQLDKSRTCVFWNDYIDLPSDTIHEYGCKIN
jgi:hypothetical protein